MIHLLPFYLKNTKIDLFSDCIIWTGRIAPNGYGQIDHSAITETAHKLTFKIFKEEKLIQGKQIDHICRNRRCVNPEHLRQVSVSINHLNSKISDECGMNKKKCKRGHYLTDPKNYNIIVQSNGRRYKNCRICKKLMKDIY